MRLKKEANRLPDEIVWLNELRSRTGHNKLSYVILAEETALVRVEKIAEPDSGIIAVRFIDLERAASCTTFLDETSAIWSLLDANGVTTIQRMHVCFQLQKFGSEKFVYCMLPYFNCTTLEKVDEEYRMYYMKKNYGIMLVLYTLILLASPFVFILLNSKFA